MKIGDKVRLLDDFLRYRKGTVGHISGIDYTTGAIHITFDRSIVSFSPQEFLTCCEIIPQLPPIPCPKTLESWMAATEPYLEAPSE